ncbi:hypothetical protein [Actinoplanes sp. NPDC049802]|uniref:hypothetical protein n=1 Tax=Actinoplanes sp. NPDC049802 TaxID=3154742 RepID=UPI0033CCF177
MEPLRDVFAGLAGPGRDPGDFLRELPEELVAEAVVSYADTAPAEVAEHLAPFVSAHSAVGGHDQAGDPGWLELLATAPVEAEPEIDETDLGFGTGADTVGEPTGLFDEDAVEITHEELPDFGTAETGLEAGAETTVEAGMDDLAVDWPEIDDLPGDGDAVL